MNLNIKLLTEKLISQMFSNYKITWHLTQVFCKAVSIGKIKIRLNILKSSVFVCFSQALKSLLAMYFYKNTVFFLKCLCLLFNKNLPFGHASVYTPPCSSNFMRPLSLWPFVFLWSTKWGTDWSEHITCRSQICFSLILPTVAPTCC